MSGSILFESSANLLVPAERLRVGFAADIRSRRQNNPGWQNFVGAPIGTLPL